MQIGDIGHNDQSHHITSGFHHSHDVVKAKTAIPLTKSASSAQAGASASQQGGFSLSTWIADPFKSIKNLAGRLWNGEDAGNAAGGVAGKALSAGEQLLTQVAENLKEEADGRANSGVSGTSDVQRLQTQPTVPVNTLHSGQIAAASTVLQPQKTMGNPYFLEISDAESRQPTFLQKVRERAQSAARQLTKRFSFAGKNPFGEKKEKPKEDLRKRSHYRRDELEIECVLTDDSYLLDSYDRSGQYSQLSTKK